MAQIQIWEFFTGLAFGFVESVDYTDGSMKIEDGPVSLTLPIQNKHLLQNHVLCSHLSWQGYITALPGFDIR